MVEPVPSRVACFPDMGHTADHAVDNDHARKAVGVGLGVEALPRGGHV